jgi:hypothetical protein
MVAADMPQQYRHTMGTLRTILRRLFYPTAALSSLLLVALLILWSLSYFWAFGSQYTNSDFHRYQIGCLRGRTLVLVGQKLSATGFHSYATKPSGEIFDEWSYLTWRTHRYDAGPLDPVTSLGVTWVNDFNVAFVLIPFSYLTLLFSVLPLLAFRSLRRRRKAQRIGLCPKCQYDLRAHAPGSACPECGTPVPRL